jgi:hypothetical protein
MIKNRRSTHKLSQMFEQSLVVFSLHVVASLDLHQSSALEHRSIGIRTEGIPQHVCLSQQNVVSRVNKHHRSVKVDKILMVCVVPVDQSIPQQVAATLEPDRVEPCLVIHLLFPQLGRVDGLVVEEESVVLGRLVLNRVQLQQRLEYAFGLFSEREGTVDQTDSSEHGKQCFAGRKKASGQIAPIAKAHNLKCILFPKDIKLSRFPTQPIEKLINNATNLSHSELTPLIIDSMRLSRIVKQYYPSISRLFQQFLTDRNVFNVRIEDIVKNENVLKGLSW